MVVPLPDEGDAVELNAGAAVGVVPSSEEDCGGSEEEVGVSVFVGR